MPAIALQARVYSADRERPARQLLQFVYQRPLQQRPRERCRLRPVKTTQRRLQPTPLLITRERRFAFYGSLMTNQDLAALRKSLDDIDAVLVSALGERARLARQIARVKAEGHGPVRDGDRETALLQHRSSLGERLGLDPAFVRRIFR